MVEPGEPGLHARPVQGGGGRGHEVLDPCADAVVDVPDAGLRFGGAGDRGNRGGGALAHVVTHRRPQSHPPDPVELGETGVDDVLERIDEGPTVSVEDLLDQFGRRPSAEAGQ